MLSEFRSEATRVFSEMKRGSTFLTVHHYMNNFGEISDFSIVFHINYHKAVARSLDILKEKRFSHADCIGKPYSLTEIASAQMELLDSFQMTLDGYNPLATNIKVYSQVDDGFGYPINGIKLNDKQDILHMNGFCIHRNILLKGNYPLDKRASKTIAKDDIKSMLPIGKYVQFKLTPGKFRKLVVANITINEEDVIRKAIN